jgi:vancomycin permeability regulator SanA
MKILNTIIFVLLLAIAAVCIVLFFITAVILFTDVVFPPGNSRFAIDTEEYLLNAMVYLVVGTSTYYACHKINKAKNS